MYTYNDDVQKIIADFLVYCGIDQGSYYFYRGRINNFFRDCMGKIPSNQNKPINAITYYDVDSYIKDLKCSDAEKVNYYNVFKRFFSYTYELSLTDNVMKGVTKPDYQRKPPKYISEDHYNLIVDYISNSDDLIKNRLLIALFLWTGLSRKYIASLRNSQFIFSQASYQLRVWDDKKSEEYILPLKSQLQVIIHEYIKSLDKECRNNKLVSCDENYLSSVVSEITKRACGKKYTPTEYSNTFIRKALINGNCIWEISKLTLESVSSIEKHIKLETDLFLKQTSILNSF